MQHHCQGQLDKQRDSEDQDLHLVLVEFQEKAGDTERPSALITENTVKTFDLRRSLSVLTICTLCMWFWIEASVKLLNCKWKSGPVEEGEDCESKHKEEGSSDPGSGYGT